MSDSYKDGKKHHEPKLLINKPIDFATSQLSKNVKAMRYCTDEEGNVWAMPVIPYKYDSTTDRVIPAPSFSRAELCEIETFAHQADATLSQSNPVSTTLYTVLDTTLNVRIYSIAANITWATTQPTPMEAVVTIDGQTVIFRRDNPVTNTYYGAKVNETTTPALQEFDAAGAVAGYRAFLIEGRSVKVQARITWATTQPTPLVVRVKYAKRN